MSTDEKKIVHISVYAHQRGFFHELCDELFFDLDLAPRANEKDETLYTPARNKTNRFGDAYGQKLPKLSGTMIGHLANELKGATCDKCMLIATMVIANKIQIAKPTGMRHLRNLLKIA